MASVLSRAFLLFASALRLRCPNCGQGRPAAHDELSTTDPARAR